MPNDSQTAKLLIKDKFGVSSTDDTRQFYEEPYISNRLVLASQIISDPIPTSNPLSYGINNDSDISGVVKIYKDKVLTIVAGTTNSFYHTDLKNSIPFNYGNGSYSYILKKNDNTVIPLGNGDWIVDNSAGVLTFYGTLPSGVSSGLPPKISYFQYIGNFGLVPSSLTEVSVLDGNNTTPSITFTSDTDTGIYRKSDGTVGITSNGTEVVTFNSSAINLTATAINLSSFNLSGPYIHSRETITANGIGINVSPNVSVTEVTINYGGIATGTLGDGTTLGQQKIICIVSVINGTYALTVTTGVGGSYTITFDTINQSLVLIWTASGWMRMGGGGGIIS